MAGQKEQGTKKFAGGDKAKGGDKFKGGDKGKGIKRSFSKAGKPGGKGKDDKKGGPTAGVKKDFKKREFKANNKRINEKEVGGSNQGLQIVRAETPEKFKKISYGKAGTEGSLNRRQKQKVSDLIKKLRINYNKLLIKKREMKITNEEKHAIVDECLVLIGTKYQELVFKHDGCRVLQSLLKYGNRIQRQKVVESIKPHYIHLMTNKYSHYLASKAYYYAPEAEQKLYFRTLVTREINKYIIHSFASEVIEYIYNLSSDQEKREMVFAFYGNYFLLLKEVEATKGKTEQVSLKDFLEKKPNLAETILHKLEKVTNKLIEKGLTRHTIVQAILYDFYQNATDVERIKNVNELLKEKLPALLASTQGLYVACASFTMLDAKDRKLVLKSLKEDIKEMFTNRLAHLFIIHILVNLDDTTLSKKKILTELLKNIDELINEKCYQNIFMGIFTPKSKQVFLPEEIEAFNAFQERTSSKKPELMRRQELLKVVLKPMESFFEEHLQFYLEEINKNPLLKGVLKAIVEVGLSEEHQDLTDEMLRHVQKNGQYEKDSQNKGILLGHPDLHRVLKELVRQEREQENTVEDLPFSTQMASVLTKNLDEVLRTRAVFIVLELVEHKETAKLILPQLMQKKKEIIKIAKEMPQAKGLQILLTKLK